MPSYRKIAQVKSAQMRWSHSAAQRLCAQKDVAGLRWKWLEAPQSRMSLPSYVSLNLVKSLRWDSRSLSAYVWCRFLRHDQKGFDSHCVRRGVHILSMISYYLFFRAIFARVANDTKSHCSWSRSWTNHRRWLNALVSYFKCQTVKKICLGALTGMMQKIGNKLNARSVSLSLLLILRTC